MIIEKRPAILLNHLLNLNHTTMNQVMNSTQLTRRQVSYDLDKINYWLKVKGLPPIEYKGIHYIKMPVDVIQFFKEQKNKELKKDFIFTEEERQIVIYLYLIIRKESISTAHLTQLLGVSKNTTISDVKKLNEIIGTQLVKIEYSRQNGYHLEGTEFDKRVLLMQFLSRLLQIPYGEKIINYILKDRDRLYEFVDMHNVLIQIEKDFNLHFVEERLKQFVYFLIYYFYRQTEEKFVLFHPDEIQILKQDSMWLVAAKISQLLQIKGNDPEICYLTIQLLGLSLGRNQVQEDDRGLLFKLCEQLVFDFESKACIAFEKKNEVVSTLYQHLKPAYFRMKYRIPIFNPLLSQIKNEHKELFTIVKELLSPIGTLLSITIPEEEIGYITIHFGALLEKPKKVLPQKKRAIVVCPSGISSSLMVKHQLEALFSEIIVEKILSLQEFREGNFNEYDLMFSTVDLETNIPCFRVKPIMTPSEKNSIVNEVYQYLFGIQYYDFSMNELIQTIEKYANVYDEVGLKAALSQITFHKKVDISRRRQPVLQDLLKEETIQMIDHLSNWEDAIKVVADPLLKNGAINRSYVDAMLENIKTMGPYVVIGPEVAIPHARPEMGVNKVGMSFLKLSKPVFFLNDEKYPVRLLFCIAAIDNKTHLKALSQLTKLLSEKENIELLKETESSNVLVELFEQYSAVN